jgi:hypothetical protein
MLMSVVQIHLSPPSHSEPASAPVDAGFLLERPLAERPWVLSINAIDAKLLIYNGFFTG